MEPLIRCLPNWLMYAWIVTSKQWMNASKRYLSIELNYVYEIALGMTFEWWTEYIYAP